MAGVAGIANGYTELSFNTGGNKEGYGGSTSALSDVAFRDARGLRDRQADARGGDLGGYGTPGSTVITAVPHPLARGAGKCRDDSTSRRPSGGSTAAGYILDARASCSTRRARLSSFGSHGRIRRPKMSSNARVHHRWFGELDVTVDGGRDGRGRSLTTSPAAARARPTTTSTCGAGSAIRSQSLLNFFRTEEIGVECNATTRTRVRPAVPQAARGIGRRKALGPAIAITPPPSAPSTARLGPPASRGSSRLAPSISRPTIVPSAAKSAFTPGATSRVSRRGRPSARCRGCRSPDSNAASLGSREIAVEEGVVHRLAVLQRDHP